MVKYEVDIQRLTPNNGEMITAGAKEGVVRVIDTVSETIDDAKTVGKFGVEVVQDVYQATQD